MQNLRQISKSAIVLLVILRMSIGWQFLYEGLWKINTLKTASPWTAAGYLKNAQGPLRSVFREMTGDPNELSWLDYDTVAARWDKWHELFLQQYPSLTDRQKSQVAQMLNGPEFFFAELEKLPDGVEFGGSLGKVIQYDEKRKGLVVDGKLHLLPQERDRLLDMVAVVESPSAEKKPANDLAKAYQKAVKDVYARSARLSFKDRLLVSLKGDPERVGPVYTDKTGEVVETRMGEIDQYKDLLDRYEANYAKVETSFQYDHLAKQWGEIQQLRAKLVGPVKSLSGELMDEARKLLTEEQIAQGAVPLPLTQLQIMDLMTMWGLTILGVLMIGGLFTPLACLGGAVMLTMFYLAIPPLPGYPPVPGPDHAFVISKNLIEAIALFGLMLMPTGRWFGIDSLWMSCLNGCPQKKKKLEPANLKPTSVAK